MTYRLAIVCSHPIQYYAPVFRALHSRGRLKLHVFYGWKGSTESAYDPGFGRDIQWDIPLLDGYEFTFVPNEAKKPGADHFRGIVAPEMVQSIRNWKPNAILIFGWNYHAHLNVLRAFYNRVPIFFRGDSNLIDEQPGIRLLMRRLLLRWIYRRVDFAFFVGSNNKSYYLKHGMREGQLFWAPHSVENERFYDRSGQHERRAREWRSELGIQEDDRVVLFVGKFDRKKDPVLLIRAFRQLNSQGVHLVLAGSGPLQRSVEEEAGHMQNVHFLGFQNQSTMPAVYRLCDVLVLPSRGPGETWGLVVNEAMSSGKAVIVSERVGCAPDLVVDGKNGFIHSAGNVADLAQKLRTVIHKNNALKMGQESLRIIQKWSIEEQVKSIETAICSHLEQ